jgi:serpin B
MPRRRTLLLVALLPLVCACGTAAPGAGPRSAGGVVLAAEPRAAPAVPAGDARALRAGNDRFGGRLLALLAGAHPTVALSPYSISETLSMAYAGARGATATQMARALEFSLPAARLSAAFNGVAQSLDGVRELRLANALYGQRGQQFRAPFLGLLARDYGAGMRIVDFKTAPEPARTTINEWVASQTARRIRELLHPGDVTERTRLAIVNAVYLHAKWLSPFKRRSTYAAPFHAAGGTVEVPTMHQTGAFGYVRGGGYRALELPYQGGRLVFDILLPDPGRLAPMLERLRSAGALPLLRGLAPQRADLALPKLRLNTRFELADALKELGMRAAFDPQRADLSGIAGGPGYLYVQAVVHQAYLNVDEAGTEAAAATGATIGISAAQSPPPLRFIVDRPFAFVLRDLASGAVLFAGVVSHP